VVADFKGKEVKAPSRFFKPAIQMFGYNTIFNLSIIRTYRSAEKVAVGPLL
jgi:hypothetical protein